MSVFTSEMRQSTGFRFFIYCMFLLLGALISVLMSIVISEPDNINNLRLAQSINSSFLFIVPPIALYAITRRQPFRALGFKKPNPTWGVLAGIAIMFTAIPLIGTLTAWNEGIELGGAFAKIEAWMRNMQQNNDTLMQKMLAVDTLGGLLFNLIAIALIPAIGEELTFRSVLQQFMVKKTRNAHVGIFITAVIFSAIHLQFYGFLPRLLLGLFLGYLFYVTGSIRTSMLMHFVNNGSAVFMYHIATKNDLDIDVERMGYSAHPLVLTMSIAVTITLLYLVWKHRVKVLE
ncbi:CPBP family intramembrane glutamic endopeptidase [Bacteroides heparinolyticus]|uniref:CPBP family intramembrane glutamic endopeptidase n=1 Tax=Prevotella heparinolytica TaxID=28113 RepID=UPI0035A14871